MVFIMGGMLCIILCLGILCILLWTELEEYKQEDEWIEYVMGNAKELLPHYEQNESEDIWVHQETLDEYVADNIKRYVKENEPKPSRNWETWWNENR